MRKLLFLTSLSLFLIQCNKKNQLPDLMVDNDYEIFNLKDRVCEINQKITLFDKTNYTIEDKNITYNFSPEGYLISDSIYNQTNNLIETNTYEKLAYPLSKKQFISAESYVLSETKYDSLKNIVSSKKTTNKNQIIEEKRNTFSNNFLIREDYFSSGSAIPSKIVQFYVSDSLIKSKVIYNQQRQILDSIVYDYNKEKQVIKENHFNSKKQLTNSEVYTYTNNKTTSVSYLNGSGEKEAIEEFIYNNKNKLIVKKTFNALDNSTYEEINEYNDNDLLIKSETKLNGELLVSSIFSYDKENNIVRLENKNLSNDEYLVKEINYVYDNKGNWITKEVKMNNALIYKAERQIKYCK